MYSLIPFTGSDEEERKASFFLVLHLGFSGYSAQNILSCCCHSTGNESCLLPCVATAALGLSLHGEHDCRRCAASS